MNKQHFYMQICHYLLTKFCDSSIKIDQNEFEQVVGHNASLKYRLNKNNQLEIVACKNSLKVIK